MRVENNRTLKMDFASRNPFPVGILALVEQVLQLLPQFTMHQGVIHAIEFRRNSGDSRKATDELICPTVVSASIRSRIAPGRQTTSC